MLLSDVHELPQVAVVFDFRCAVHHKIICDPQCISQEFGPSPVVTVPTSVSSSQLSNADVTSHTTTNAVLGDNVFRLSGQQRYRTRSGFGIQASSRPEINGAASAKLRGYRQQPQNSKSSDCITCTWAS